MGEASTLHHLATIDLNSGEYEGAKKKLDIALKIDQQIGDRMGEASTWHNLASIDLNRGEYKEAKNKLDTTLKIRQQIGDFAG